MIRRFLRSRRTDERHALPAAFALPAEDAAGAYGREVVSPHQPGELFTPSRPQRDGPGFVGRDAELSRIRQALEEDHVHVVLYADRGYGKTSLANRVAAELRAGGAMVARYACEMNSDFDEIMRGLMRDLPSSFLAVPALASAKRPGCEAILPEGEILPADVAALPRSLSGSHLLLVVDEFDRVRSEATRTRFADVIKRVSDYGSRLSFVIVGVSASLEELLGRHPSIRRSIVGIQLPVMTDAEVERIINRGAQGAGVVFLPEARRGITILATGVPYLVHLLALRAVQSARGRGSTIISLRDVREAATRIVNDAEPQTVLLCNELAQQFGAETVAQFLRHFARPPVPGRWPQDAEIDREMWDRLVEVGAVLRTAKGSAVLSDSGLGFYLLLHALALDDDADRTPRLEPVRSQEAG